MPIFNFNRTVRHNELYAFSDMYTSRNLFASSANFTTLGHPKDLSFSDNHDGLFSQADLRTDFDISEHIGQAKAKAFSGQLILHDISVKIVKYVDIKLVPGEVYPIILDRNFVLPDMFTDTEFDSLATIQSISFASVQCLSCTSHTPLDYQIEFPESNQAVNVGCSRYQDTNLFTDERLNGDTTVWQMMEGSGVYQLGYTPVIFNGNSIAVCNLRTLTSHECEFHLRIKLRLSLPVKY
jgi:hypothetical protein